MRYRMKWSRWALPALAVAVLITASQVGTAAGQQTPAELDYSVYREQIEPILLRDRGGYGPGVSACVTCHIQSGTPMRLEPLEEDGSGGVYWTEQQSRRNFDLVSGLVAPGQPEQSRLLRAPSTRMPVVAAFTWAASSGSPRTTRTGRPWRRG